jgi:hypothetical protein
MRRVLGLLALWACAAAAQGAGEWGAGVAKAVITPREPIWLAGFAFRNKPSEGVRQDIYVRALALRDQSGKTSALVTLDLASIDRPMADELAQECRKRYGIERDRLLLNISHTHSGPVAGLKPLPIYGLTGAHHAVVQRYTAELMRKTVEVVGAAIHDLAPAALSFEQGLAGIAVNRRRVSRRSLPGPVDQDVPVLAVRDPAGKLRALVVGYACHATALSDYLISNDWPGYAVEAIEKAHAGATALFIQGAGADANALPRSGEDLARTRGLILAAAVEQVLNGKMRPLSATLRTAFERVDVPFREPLTRDELQRRLDDRVPAIRNASRYLLGVLEREGKFADRYPYPIQVWRFGGDLKLIALGGEVVADYALRLKGQHGFETTWVAGYSNDIMAYIPSRRVLLEGGYEGGDALIYFGLPGRFGAAVEEIIIEKTAQLVQRTDE